MRILYCFILFFFLSAPSFGQFTTDPVKEGISLYPNPASSTLWIKTSNENIQKSEISIYNVLGNKLDLQVNKIEEGRFSIEVETLPAGYYLLVVDDDETSFTKTLKFLKR